MPHKSNFRPQRSKISPIRPEDGNATLSRPDVFRPPVISTFALKMNIDEFLRAAWNDHGDAPEAVAHRLAASLHLVEAPEKVPAFANLLQHVYGEHLGQWQHGIALLQELRGSPAVAQSSSAVDAIDRATAALGYAGGEHGVLEPFVAEDQVRVLSTAFSALAARGEFQRAIAAFDRALQLANSGLPSESPAQRALAACSNNLAVALEAKRDRNDSEADVMVASAEAALHFWKLAGTWLEEERAEYRLARSLLAAGQREAAVHCASRCLTVCEQNAAPPFELFFAHAIVAMAHRAADHAAMFEEHRRLALSQYEALPQPERESCESDRRELES